MRTNLTTSGNKFIFKIIDVLFAVHILLLFYECTLMMTVVSTLMMTVVSPE